MSAPVPLSGWGGVPTSRAAQIVAGGRAAEAVMAAGPRGIIARGLGRAYGDAAQNAGGTVVDMTSRAAVHDLDLHRREITVDAGVSFDLLLRVLVPLGLFVPVTPGTRQVTVGGAIAADIHGKNHHVDGTFGQHVRSLRLLVASGEVINLSAGEPAFQATLGGMGLTGIVLDATFALLAIETSTMLVDTERASDLDDLLSRMQERDGDYRYSVAWIDTIARGRRMGRGVLTRGDHAPVGALTGHDADGDAALRFAPRTRLAVPPVMPAGLLNPFTIRAFNEAWFQRAPRESRGRPTSIGAFFHPLDGVRAWNRLYGPGGFLQYQVAVPFGAEETLRHLLERLSASGAASFLAVLKRFGAEAGLLSFPMPGWTLALDIPARIAGLGPLLDDLDERVASAGGRVYLAKDSRLSPEMLARMYPRLEEWRAVRQQLDPQRRFRSDLASRLGLL